MTKKRLEAWWQGYDKAVLPKTVGPVQRIETRRAFYAGALAYSAIVGAGVSESDEYTTEDHELMEGLHAELVEFAQKLGRGEA